MILAAITNNQDVSWALAIVAFVLACVIIVQSKFTALIGFAVGIVSLALILFWWP